MYDYLITLCFVNLYSNAVLYYQSQKWCCLLPTSRVAKADFWQARTPKWGATLPAGSKDQALAALPHVAALASVRQKTLQHFLFNLAKNGQINITYHLSVLLLLLIHLSMQTVFKTVQEYLCMFVSQFFFMKPLLLVSNCCRLKDFCSPDF